MNDDNLLSDREGEKRRAYWGGILTGILIALLICSCVYLVMRVKDSKKNEEAVHVPEMSQQDDGEEVINDVVIGKLQILLDTIEAHYLNEIHSEELVDGLYYGLLESLGDPYSVYYTQEELEDMISQTEGIYYGIGAYIGFNTEANMCYVSKLIKNTPAAASDLSPGDFIVKVDGTDTIGMTSSEIVKLIKGPEGTSVTITVQREGEKNPLDITVARAKIESPTVEYEMLENSIGYIEITEFDDVTYAQYCEAYDTLVARGMKGLILDLRANPGGNVSTVCQIARRLLPEGLIVYTEDKYGQRMEYRCDGTEEIQIPLAVLVDGNSASASEILAGAIKDYGIGKLVGTTTFGKGIVQRIISFSDGTAIKLTISNYFTPNGNYIHGVGIEPDIPVEWDSEQYLNEGIDNQKQAAIEYLLPLVQ
ncbi:MAG: S41 family peptidase [Lachnospiraceae bacterium]